MAERETLPKRPREEEAEGEEITVETKRHNPQQSQQQQRPSSFHGILSSLLEEEAGGEGEEGEISSLMTALQQELCSSSAGSSSPPPELPGSGYHLAEEECDVEGVLRRLLEASDDDLGIPPSGDAEGEGTAAVALEQQAVHSVEEEQAEVCGGGGGTALFVETLEMDAINGSYYHYDYYALLQPELFL